MMAQACTPCIEILISCWPARFYILAMTVTWCWQPLRSHVSCMAHAYTACINIMPASSILYIGHDNGMVLTIPHVRPFRPQRIHGLSWPWHCYHSYRLTRLHHPRPTHILNACSRTDVSCHGQDASCD